jgi:hypothetical protein
MSKTELNPVFDDLNNPETILKHVEKLKRTVEYEQKAKQNPFPVEVLPEAVREIITATNESLNFPIDFIGASILYAVSVAIGNTHRAEIMKGYDQNAVLYMAIVGRTGTNKSHPLSFALKPIEQRDSLKFQEYQRKKIEYDTIVNLTKKEREQQDEPVKPIWEQCLVTDFTPEALTDVHKFNKRGIGVYSDELASWFKNFNRYNKGSEEQFWLSVWSGKPIRINRKTSEPAYIPLPFISVAGTIQTGVLNELAKNRTENGFLDRLLFVMPDNLKKEYWSEKELNPEIDKNWNIIVSNLLNMPLNIDENQNPEPEILQFTQDAKKRLWDWQNQITDLCNAADNDVLSGIYAKMEMYAIRLSLIIELLKYACDESNKQTIGINSVEGAIKLTEYFTKVAIKVHSFISNASPVDKLPTDKQNIYNALPDTFTTSEGVRIAERMEMAPRTFKRFLVNRELFNNHTRGEYEKRY